MLITLTQNIYEHEKQNMDVPLVHPFMCFILQNVVSILFYFKVLFLQSVQLIHCYLPLYNFLLPLPPGFCVGLDDL